LLHCNIAPYTGGNYIFGDTLMDSLGSAFELVVLSVTSFSMLALAAFIGWDAIAERRALASARTQKAVFGSPQPLRRARLRRSKGDRTAAARAA
jgi:hypothetical protein